MSKAANHALTLIYSSRLWNFSPQVPLYLRSLLPFLAEAASASASVLASPVGETACIAESCAGNFPVVVQRSAPTPSVPSPLHALTNAERLVRGMPLKALVHRRSGAYLLFLYDKSVRLTVLTPQILSAG